MSLELIKRRQDAIARIGGLFPADSDYPDLRETGRRLLDEAKRLTEDWRTLPLETLEKYASLCEKEEQQQFRRVVKGQGI